MMNDIKRVIKLMKYGDQFGMYLIMGILWLLFGGIMMLTEAGTESYVAVGLFFMIPSLALLQSFASLEAGGMAASSGKRRFLGIRGQNLFMVWGVGILCFLVFVTVLVKYLLFPSTRLYAGGTLLCTGLSAAVLMIYIALVNKSFIGGLVVFLLLYIGYFITGSFILEKWRPSFVPGLLLGLAAFVLGSIISSLLRDALYKKPISKFSLGAEMRKYM